MKIASDVLSRFTAVPHDAAALRELLDDTGLEVKRMAADGSHIRFTLELLANRGDHHSYLGIARELSGRTGGVLHVPLITELTLGETPWPIVLQSDLCARYSATLLERKSTGSLGAGDLRVLEAAEIHELGAVIDSTNLANLEFGQPTHAFDADKLDGAITIRLSKEGEQAWPLFQEEKVTLPTGTLVIADDSKILAIAGVIGCEESKATDTTQRVVLESAAFDPIAVRKASRALGIFTDSSARFERGSDPSQVLVGAGRVVHLLEGAGWERVGTTGLVGTWEDPGREILFHVDHAAGFLGLDLTHEDVVSRLERYGFEINPQPDGHLVARVPPHRFWDVEYDADLYEELAKSIGYNEGDHPLPAVDQGALPTPFETMQVEVEEVLLGAGFYEVFTDGFYGAGLLEGLGVSQDHPLAPHVRTTNALDRGYSYLKNNAFGQAVASISQNLRVMNPEIKAYEWTRTFHPDPSAENGACRERSILWGIVNGHERPPHWSGASRPADAIFLKGLVEEIGRTLALPLEFGHSSTDPLSTLLHPNRQSEIRLAGKRVGILGEVHPQARKNFKLKQNRPCYFEIEIDALLSPGQPTPYVEPTDRHPVVRALALTLPHRQEAGEIASFMSANGPAWLTKVDVIDRFDHEEDGQPVRTLTFGLTYSNDPVTRTAEELTEATDGILAAVTTTFAERGVHQR